MTKLSLLGLSMGLMVASCDAPKSTGKTFASATEINSAEFPDTMVYQEAVLDSLWNYNSDDDFLSEYQVGIEGRIQVPSFQQNPLLANAVMEWVCEQIGCHYEGDLQQGRAMLQQKLAEMEPEESLYLHVSKVYETPRLVTYLIESYLNPVGAAHGTPSTVGATFRKSDGKIFAGNLISGDSSSDYAADELQPFLKQGLKSYFEVSDDKQLLEQLFLDEVHDIDHLPLPVTSPWVTKEGIVFLYQPYEIACYAAGQPSVVIPIDNVKSILTPAAKKLLSK